MERGKILDIAKKIINTERQDAYGKPEDCFKDIGTLWSWYIGKVLKPKEVAIMMALLKLAREHHNHKKDNLVDACGYLALANDLEDKTDGPTV